MIRVLLVDDSPVAVAILKRMLSKSKEIEIVGTAVNGIEALNLIPQLMPDVVCTDLHMPVMDGLEFTKEVMERHPLPILLVSVSGREDSLNAFKVIEAGAIDIFLKPAGIFEPDHDKHISELIMKIRILSKVHVFRKFKSPAVPEKEKPDVKSGNKIVFSGFPLRIIVIGASTGGPQALQAILTGLPSDFPLPIVCVQHISDGFLQGLVDWLSSLCRMKVEIAREGGIPKAGTIYFPKEKTHVKFDSNGRFVLSSEPPLDGHCPSVTVLMKSAAGCFGNSALGVLLTGMGKDGAEGLLAIKKAGGRTIAQNEESSVIFGMPKQAIDLGAAEYISSLDDIGQIILDFALNNSERKYMT